MFKVKNFVFHKKNRYFSVFNYLIVNHTFSVAILRYLSKAYPIEEHWYPQDAKQQALVDEFLEWQHIGLRIPCGMYFVTKVLVFIKIIWK